ncbi:protein glass-like isoform X3 [Ostrea edulis]|uniref:protein glass-like isoform X3 n=1 Tax=Ostrea edulis TaxID=37623 RepID=UPI0024AF91B7|nr:protein glass-like isoform X3 [Ostrea edulis]
MNYQKAYMNQIFSSSLMGQVAEMWRNQFLCDAIIRTGSTDTKAHRLVLVAACPMLQTMENAAVGSHLEVRLSAEIKPESVQTFLKYLYEGFMMLTGDNYRDIEKIAKILQVESVVRCCTDFSKCLSEKTGVPCEKRFSMNENPESVYVRSSDLLKVHDPVKRHSEGETVSPEGERKRQKMNRPTPPPPLLLPMHNIANSERVLHSVDMSRSSDTDRSLGMIEADYSQGIQTSSSSTSEVEIMKDSIEIVHREPPDPNNINQSEPPIQQTMALSVASRVSSDRNTQVVNMTTVLPHSRSSSTQNLHILGSPHSSSRKPEAAHSMDSEPRTPETHKNHDRRHLLTGDSHSRYHQRQNSLEMSQRKHDSYPSNLPSSEILGSNLHDQSAKSVSSPSVAPPQPSSPYRPPISMPLRHPTSSQMQKSFIQPMFRPGIPFDGRPFAGVPIGSLRHMAGGILPPSLAPPLHISYNIEDSIKDHGSSSSVPNSPCTPSVPDLSIIKTEESRENEELHIDIPEESASGTTTPHNNTEEEPLGDDSSNAGSEGGSLWQDNSVKDEAESVGVVDLCGVESAMLDCRYCSEHFSHHSAIMAHFSSVNNHQFCKICPQCYKGFKSRKGYRNHQKMQHTDAADCPSCDVCGKRFPALSNLIAHRRTHSSVRPFHCCKCRKGFKNQYHLKRHLLSCQVGFMSKR